MLNNSSKLNRTQATKALFGLGRPACTGRRDVETWEWQQRHRYSRRSAAIESVDQWEIYVLAQHQFQSKCYTSSGNKQKQLKVPQPTIIPVAVTNEPNNKSTGRLDKRRRNGKKGRSLWMDCVICGMFPWSHSKLWFSVLSSGCRSCGWRTVTVASLKGTVMVLRWHKEG